MKKLISILVALIICLALPFGALAEGKNLVKNGDFENPGADNLPAGWRFVAYYNDPESSNASIEHDAEHGNVLLLASTIPNDLHFNQVVKVKSDKVYKISCFIKTENVKGGAGANIAIENIICRTDPLLGTKGWTSVEIIGKTDKNQKELSVSCRLGGYGGESTGKAWFDGFAVEELKDYNGKTVNFFNSVQDKPGNQGSDNKPSKPKDEQDYLEIAARKKMTIILICVYVLAPLAIAVFLKYEKDCDKRREKPLKITPAQSAPSFFDTSGIPKQTDTKLHYTKKDWIFVCALTLVYTVVTVLNLGSLSAPENQWEGVTGDTASFIFDDNVEIGKILVYGGIAGGHSNDKTDCPEYTITGDDGASCNCKQLFGEMYRWRNATGSLNSTTKTLTLTVTKSYNRYDGKVKINELAFYDKQGNLLNVHAADKASEALVDEQDTIPEYPSYMTGMYFDELYHGRTAYEHLHGMKIYEWTHPPLGKTIISIGIAIFGMNPFGWRIMGALFGAAMIPVMYAFGKRMFKRSELALLASFLFAFDFMHFTQTRIATVDTYGVFFNLCMTYYMYKFMKMDLGDSFKDSLVPLALSGLFFGIGCASKWICLYTGAALAVMFFAKMFVMWEKANKLKKADLTAEQQKEPAVINAKKYPQRFLKTCLCCVVFFVIIPLIIYTASYYPYWRGEWKQQAIAQKVDEMFVSGELAPDDEIPENPLTAGDTVKAYVKGVVENQKSMYAYHSGLKSTHPYQSNWYEWPLGDRPMWFYSGYSHPNTKLYGTISSFGNPAVWWVCFIGTLTLVIMLISRKFKCNTEILFMLLSMASSMLPWMMIKRSVFIYHYFATVPMIILASVYVLKHFEDKYYYQPLEEGRMLGRSSKFLPNVKWIWMVLTLVLFIVFYPVISGTPVSRNYISALQWLPTWTFMGAWH